MDSPRNTNPLSSSKLKIYALSSLSGNLGKFILAVLLMFTLQTIVQFAFEVIVGGIYFFVVFTHETLTKGLTPEELLLLLEDTTPMQPYLNTFSLIDYFAAQIASIFTNVFSAGVALYALNIACDYGTKISDLFYGYRYQFSKALKLSALIVLLQQFSSLPLTYATHLWNINADYEPIIYALAISLMGALIYLPLYYGLAMCFFLMADFPEYNVRQLIKLSRNLMSGHKFRFFLLELSFLPLLLLSLLTFGIAYLWIYPYMQVTYAFFFLNLMQTKAHKPIP